MEILWIAVVILALAGGAAAWFYIVRSRAPKEEPVYYYKCECKRKLRYFARQVNHKGICPLCRRQFTFPPIPAPAAKGRR
jgi:hypothetical protein